MTSESWRELFNCDKERIEGWRSLYNMIILNASYAFSAEQSWLKIMITKYFDISWAKTFDE